MDFKQNNNIEQIYQDYLQREKIIKDERYLNDEKLTEEERLNLIYEIFNTNVREEEIKEISYHTAPLLKNDNISNLNILGPKGSGKTITISFILSHLKQKAEELKIPIENLYIDCNTYDTCFNILNDIAFKLDAYKRLKSGVHTSVLQNSIFQKIKDKDGILVIVLDEIDKVKYGLDELLLILCKVLPRETKMKVFYIFISNYFTWSGEVDSRASSVMNLRNLRFKPHSPNDLIQIMNFRVPKAVDMDFIKDKDSLFSKISALAANEDGDARLALKIIERCARIAEKNGTKIKDKYIEEANLSIDISQVTDIIDSLALQQKLVLLSCYLRLKNAVRLNKHVFTGDVYDAYQTICGKYQFKTVTQRRVSNFLSDLDLYGAICSRIISKGRYGRTKEIKSSVSSLVIPSIIKKLEDEIFGKEN